MTEQLEPVQGCDVRECETHWFERWEKSVGCPYCGTEAERVYGGGNPHEQEEDKDAVTCEECGQQFTHF